MLSSNQKKLLELDLRQFPILAAASASIKACPKCSHARVNQNIVLRAACTALSRNKVFKAFLSKHFKLPVTLGGITFK